MRQIIYSIALITFLSSFGQPKQKASAAKTSGDFQKEGIFANIETTKGTILLSLTYQATPVTVANFISLAEGTNIIAAEKYRGTAFYDGLKFHRVIADFMIQGGDPMGNGSGDPGYKFKDEITDATFDKAGILAMANAGPGTNGSQFFITHKETPWLNGRHTIFGYVVTGQDVVNAIKQDDLITRITIIRNGAEAEAFNAPDIFSNYYNNKAIEEEQQQRKQKEAEEAAKKAYEAKFGPAIAAKKTYLAAQRKEATALPSGLAYKVIKKGKQKPAAGTSVYVHYAGFLEDGSLFDTSYAAEAKIFGKFDERRGEANYQPFPFQAGKKDGLIPGFIEALENMAIGDKIIAWIPAKLGYGERGAGKVIPPNSNIIFEIELLDAMPTPAKK